MARVLKWRLGAATLSTIAACAAAGSAFAGVPLCKPDDRVDAPPNNLAWPEPLGLVDNRADDPPGLDLVDLRGRPPGSHETLQWGDVRWREPSIGCAWVSQTLDFWPNPDTMHGPWPTIVYFHPNGVNSHVEPGSKIYDNVVQVALANGFNFVSVEFRHPVVDQYLAVIDPDGQVPKHDVAEAIQYLRRNAGELNISANNLFAFGFSRGSLALWQALQPDVRGARPDAPSTAVSAFVGYQAPTTFQCGQYADLFVVDAQDAMLECEAENPAWPQFDSAIDAVTSQSVPVRLQYALGFELVWRTKNEIHKRPLHYIERFYKPEHYPDFGIALCNRYADVGNPGCVRPIPYVDFKDQFVGWLPFVTPLLKPDF